MAYGNKTGVAMTGAEVEYTIPAGTTAIALRPDGGDITLAWAKGGATFPIYGGEAYELDDPNIGSLTIYLTGAVGVTVYAIYRTHYAA